MSISEYEELLEGFDWYYEFSDDYRVWSRENRKHDYLKAITSQSQQHKALYDKYWKKFISAIKK